MAEFARIIMATDGSPQVRTALSTGFKLAKRLRVPVLGLYVIDRRALDPYPRASLLVDLRSILVEKAERALAALKAQGRKAGVRVETRIIQGTPEKDIARAARPRDLIVISTHARRGLSRLLLGSVAENVVRHAPCPVLVVHNASR